MCVCVCLSIVRTVARKLLTFCSFKSVVENVELKMTFLWLLVCDVEDEFRVMYLNPMLSQWSLQKQMKPAAPVSKAALDRWDWREHGAVSSVKNQVRENEPTNVKHLYRL